MTNDEKTAVDTVMRFLDCYADRNVEGCMALLTTRQPIFMLGTNENEVFRTADEVRSAFTRDFASMTAMRWGQQRHMHVVTACELASVTVEMSISYESDGKRVATIFRYALTLVKEAAEWKICSGLASVPFTEGTYKFPE